MITRPWYAEEYTFKLEVLHLDPDDQPKRCRVGHEPGDHFLCGYGCPGVLFEYLHREWRYQGGYPAFYALSIEKECLIPRSLAVD